jgi:hypothetical protein
MNNRSPVIFWLLMIATISVDLIALGLVGLLGRANEISSLVFGLAFSQLSAVSIWIVFAAPPGQRRWIIAAAAVAIAALAIAFTETGSVVFGAAGISATHLVTLIVMLWVIRAAERRRRDSAESQFSVKNLLVLMTIVAVVAALLGGVTGIQQRLAWIFHFLGNNVAVAVATFLLWSRKRHWVWRLLAVLVVSALFGWCLTLSRPDLSPEAIWMSCLQAVVVFVWLEWGGIIPRAADIGCAASLDSVP